MLFIGKEGYTIKKITLTALFFLVIFLTACGGQKGLEEINQAGNEVAGDVTDAMTNETSDATQANAESDTQKPNIEALPNEETDFGALDYNVSDEERWNWTADAKTIFDMNAGVCIQVAQLATYMLADDFEDWGVVMIEGNQGHIFNWFFEDGKYYVFDFTEVISDNCGRGYEFEERFGYRDYSRKVQVFDNIEDFKNWCITSKVDVTQNYAVYMYSCQGHDFIAANINSGMSSSFDAMNGGFDEILLCYQDVVMEDLVVFYLSEISNAKFVSIPTEEVPWEIPIGVYNRGEKTWYFEYE